jgi:ankyrin repeat protein
MLLDLAPPKTFATYCLQDGANMNSTGCASGGTALVQASSDGHFDIVCVNCGNHTNLDVNLPNIHGSTALIHASNQGHLAIVIELLKHDKINVNHMNHVGVTALITASSKGHTNIVTELLKCHELDVNLRSGK